LSKPNSNVVSGDVTGQNELTQPDSKLAFVEPTVSTPEDVLEATTFFERPTVDTTTT